MPTAYTSLLGLALPVTGELQGTWGTTVNDAITSLLDTAVAGTTTLSTDADVTLTTTTGASNQARQAIILWTANGSVTRNITAPAQSKTYVVINASAGTQSIVFRGVGPTTGVTIIKGERAVVAWNGSDFVKVGVFNGALTVSDLTDSSLTSGRVTYATTGGNLTDSANLTFNGTTLTANALSLTTALSVPNGGTGLTSGTSGGLPYFNATNTMASSGLLAANALMIGGGAGAAPSTTTTATGILTFLGTPSSANLAAAVTDETGSGSLVFATSPTITTPTISSGNLSFSGTAQRITGDMSNATIANRLLFQTSTSNSSTTIAAIPNGTATASAIVAHNNSDPANSSSFSFLALTAETRIASGIQGTGTYLPITFYTTASERMRIDTSGNVALGESTSTAPPAGAATPTVVYRTSNNGRVWAVNTATTNSVGFTAASNTYNTSFENVTMTIGGSAATGTTFGIANAYLGALQFINTNNAVIGTNGGSPLIFATSNQERMRIDFSGNVGIGGTPSFKLDVGGGALGTTAGNQVIVERLSTTTSNADHLEFSKIRTTNGTDWTTAGWRLQQKVDSTWHGYIQFNGTNNLEGISFGTSGSTVSANSVPEAMRITSAGNVGIGTTSPGTVLHTVRTSAGAATVGAFIQNADNTTSTEVRLAFAANNSPLANDRYAWIGHINTGSTNGGALTFATTPGGQAATERMRITATGNVVAGGSVALATTATDGFLYVPTCAGAPTGTPTAITGMAPIVVNTTNNKLYFYSGGAWRDAGP